MTLIPLAGYSQNETSTQFTVAGVIVDATGEPLVGTAVYVKNEPGVGVVADLDGKFKIKVTKNATLIFQSVGMKNVEMLITKNSESSRMMTCRMPYIPFFRKTNSDRAIFIMRSVL